MAVTFDLPESVEVQLRREVPDLDEAAREQFIISQYQKGRLSTGDVALILGFETRYQAEQWLGQRGVRANYNLESLEADNRALERILDRTDS
jgi:predicted HTH domain antitoxin